jgi:4-hydroxybenzoate polyprenyltransferase
MIENINNSELKEYAQKMSLYWGMARVKDWIKFYPLFPLAGAVMVGGSPPKIALILASYLMLIAYGFVVNNYFDVEIDKKHKEKVISNKNPLASGLVGRKEVEAMMAALLLGSFVLSIQLNMFGAVLLIANAVLLTLYSGVLRLKEVPIADIITHGLMFGAIPLAAGAVLAGGEVSAQLIAASGIAFLLGCEALVAHQVIDYEEDLGNTRTTVTMIGQRRGLILLAAISFGSVVLFIIICSGSSIPAVLAGFGLWFLLAYPVYSCRGALRDIRRLALPE